MKIEAFEIDIPEADLRELHEHLRTSKRPSTPTTPGPEPHCGRSSTLFICAEGDPLLALLRRRTVRIRETD